MTITFVKSVAWLSIVLAIYGTFAGSDFVRRIYRNLRKLIPQQGSSVYFQRLMQVCSFMVIGVLFSVAYPGHALALCWMMICAVTVLELLQNLTSDRHGTVADAFWKMSGGIIGVAAGFMLNIYGSTQL